MVTIPGIAFAGHEPDMAHATSPTLPQCPGQIKRLFLLQEQRRPWVIHDKMVDVGDVVTTNEMNDLDGKRMQEEAQSNTGLSPRTMD